MLTEHSLGSLSCIGPNYLVTDDPEIIWRMNAARSSYQRSEWYSSQRVDPFQDNVFSQRDVEKHDSLKRKLTSGVSTLLYLNLIRILTEFSWVSKVFRERQSQLGKVCG